MKFLLVLLALWTVETDGANPPCNSKDGCTYNEHYMDTNIRIKPSLQSGLTHDEKVFLLHEHNRLRRRQAKGEIPGLPGASDMTEMIWDEELAQNAQRYVENCVAAHGDHAGQGQSFSVWKPAEGALEAAVNGWFLAEYTLWQYGTDPLPAQAGHYTQMVTAFSNKVGCGYKNCGSQGGLVFCHYLLPGNVKDKNPFTAGEACTKCPDGYGYCDDGLCATKDICTHRHKCKCIVDQETCNTNGKFDAGSCTCECNPGWRGASCSEPCVDDEKCIGRDDMKDEVCHPTDDFYMDTVIFCPTVCGTCTPAEGPKAECVDTTEECNEWAEDDGCEANPDYMYSQCPVACKQCVPGEEKKKRHNAWYGPSKRRH